MKQKRLFYISGCGYIVSSLSVLPMAFGDMSGQHESKALAVISAVLFWLSLLIAVIAQLMLRKIQKPYRKKYTFWQMVLTPPARWFEILFLFGIVLIVLFLVFDLNGFAFYLALFFALVGVELSILTAGKLRRKDGRLVLNIYHTQTNIRGNLQ